LTLKAYTKGEHVLRFEAIVHNTKALRCGRVLDNFPRIIDRLASMVDRFTTTLDCVDTTFIADGLLDRLPAPVQLGATRVGGVDLNKPRIRGALAAVLALSACRLTCRGCDRPALAWWRRVAVTWGDLRKIVFSPRETMIDRRSRWTACTTTGSESSRSSACVGSETSSTPAWVPGQTRSSS
jgi:hypothetical protein